MCIHRDSNHETSHAPRRRRATLLVALAVILLGMLAGACTPDQLRLQQLVNDERTNAGLTPLLPSPHASAKAQAWAEELSRSGTLRHSRLDEAMPEGYLQIGENVGRGPDIETIHLAFMDSPGHRANILDPAYGWVGTGYARSPDGVVYVAVVFARY